MLILFWIWYLNFKGGQLYPAPPIVSWSGAGLSLVPVGLPWGVSCAVVGPRYFVFWCREVGMQGWVGGWVGGGLVCGGGARLPEQCQAVLVFPLRSLHTDFLCRHPWPSDAPVCGPQKSDCNPTLDVSARLWVGLLPLWCEATGYPFQGRSRLHYE